MTNRRLFVAAAPGSSRARSPGRSRSRAQARPARRCTSASLNDAGAPVPDLGPADFIVREDNVAREVLQRRAGRSSRCRSRSSSTTARRRATYIPHIRPALPAFVDSADRRGGVKNEVAIIAVGERPTILTDYTIEPGASCRRASTASGRCSGTRRLPARRASSKSARASRSAARARPVIVAITTEGPEFSDRQHDQVLDPLRASGAALHVDRARPPVGQHERRSARARTSCSTRGRATTGGRRDELLASMALGGTLKQLADELTHQYRVTYARPQSLIPPERVTVTRRQAGRDGARHARQGSAGRRERP